MSNHIYDQNKAAQIEHKWQRYWEKNKTYQTDTSSSENPYFVADMFPFPSGKGLHVGHPLNYIGSDTHARFKRMQGKNVVHAMGFDAFGLPTEQYAIETGMHPKEVTSRNINTYKHQLARIGLGHDKTRTFATSDEGYYKFTQWMFLEMFHSFFNHETSKAEPISKLVKECEEGTRTAGKPWGEMSEVERNTLINSQRLAYLQETEVNWCPGLGVVLADTEIKPNGRSVKGNHPVFSKTLTQWTLRISAYKERLIEDLKVLDWPDAIKRQQINWINGVDGNPMHDWVFGRQRYWGEPFPIVYDQFNQPHALPTSMLPVVLPHMEDFTPPVFDPEDADSSPVTPLGRNENWVNVTIDIGNGVQVYRRDTNTMPQWAGSCWYYLRYLDPENSERFINEQIESLWMGPNEEKPLGGVDLYVGGREHAVMHLLYARFWHKVLFDLGHVSSPEPFARLFNQGYVQAWHYRNSEGTLVEAEQVVEHDGEFFYHGERVSREYGKMGKSLKNSVAPDQVCDQYGADTFRIHQMSAAPLEANRAWEQSNVIGSYRFLQKLWRTVVDEATGKDRTVNRPVTTQVAKAVNVLLETAANGYQNMSPNVIQAKANETITILSATPYREAVEKMILALAPMIPHIAQELWEIMGHTESIVYVSFPEPFEVQEETMVTVPVQVDKKVRAKITVKTDSSEGEVMRVALNHPDIRKHVGNVSKVVWVKNKILSIS